MTPKQFESAVASLLKLAGATVKSEMQIGSKRVDAYAETYRYGKPWRIAVECKLKKRPLPKEEVVAIFADYLALLDKRHVDEILLVTSHGLAPSAMTYVHDIRGLFHQTFLELENSVIDFQAYLMSLQRQVSLDGLDSYYVRPVLADGRDLHSLVESWIEESDKPLAILGSYGMGKTSFAHYLAATLARRCGSDPTARIPIYLPLGDISAEQSLEGLLGRVLATNGQVRNYTFQAFAELNRRGRFVVLYDGFDEMKHTLSKEQLRFNFRELNRLVEGDARVILLGRPSAFLSDEEQRELLHGESRTGSDVLKDIDWPDFVEIELQPFSDQQASDFLVRYSTYLTESGKLKEAAIGTVRNRLESLPPDRIADITTRPVQLRMLAEILPQWDEDIAELTLTRLYSTFIDLAIRREQSKLSRSRFSGAARREFARSLAFWLWVNRSSMNIDGEQIPMSLFPKPSERESEEGVRRDMLSACFLEKKVGSALYFPHRSFQEFLVAEYLLHRIRAEAADLRALGQAITDDVPTFLLDMATPADAEHFADRLRQLFGSIPVRLLSIWTRDTRLRESVKSVLAWNSMSRWAAVFAAVDALHGPNGNEDEFLATATEGINYDMRVRQPALFATFVVAKARPTGEVSRHIADILFTYGAVAVDSLTRSMRRVSPGAGIRKFETATNADAETLRRIRVIGISEANIAQLDIGGAFGLLYEHVRDVAGIDDWIHDGRNYWHGDRELIVTTDCTPYRALLDSHDSFIKAVAEFARQKTHDHEPLEHS